MIQGIEDDCEEFQKAKCFLKDCCIWNDFYVSNM